MKLSDSGRSVTTNHPYKETATWVARQLTRENQRAFAFHIQIKECALETEVQSLHEPVDLARRDIDKDALVMSFAIGTV